MQVDTPPQLGPLCDRAAKAKLIGLPVQLGAKYLVAVRSEAAISRKFTHCALMMLGTSVTVCDLFLACRDDWRNGKTTRIRKRRAKESG